MLTPDEVLRELNHRGYAITPRRLVDWRQKELLPSLVKRGRDQGRGWVYVWEDPLIVEQVIAVQELLRMRERTAWLYVPLWCLGFDVPLERVRSQLLARIERQQAFLTGGERDPDELGFRLSQLALTEVTRPGPRRGRSQESADVLEYWFHLLTGDAEYTFDWEALTRVAIGLRSFTRRDVTMDEKDRWIESPAGLRLIRRWARRYAAVPRLEEAVVNATEHEWDAVHADWQALAHAVRTAGAFVAEEDTWKELHTFWFRVIAVAGPWVSLVDLSMRLQGRGETWDDIREGLWQFTERLAADPELQHQSRLLWQEVTVSGP